MKIEFTKGGGFAAPLRTVKGTVTVDGEHGEVTGDPGYQRTLSGDEAGQIRSAVKTGELPKAAALIASHTRGAADLDHYHLHITDDDGSTHDLDFNTSGSPSQLEGISPEVATLIRWLRTEAQKIQANRTS